MVLTFPLNMRSSGSIFNALKMWPNSWMPCSIKSHCQCQLVWWTWRKVPWMSSAIFYTRLQTSRSFISLTFSDQVVDTTSTDDCLLTGTLAFSSTRERKFIYTSMAVTFKQFRCEGASPQLIPMVPGVPSPIQALGVTAKGSFDVPFYHSSPLSQYPYTQGSHRTARLQPLNDTVLMEHLCILRHTPASVWNRPSPSLSNPALFHVWETAIVQE